MAFPTIPTTGNGRLLSQNQNDTSQTRTFPSLSSLTKNSGDLLIAIAVAYQRSASGATWGSWGGGFTERFDIDGGANLPSFGIATKISDGTETGTFTVTQATTVTGHASLFLLSIPGVLTGTALEVTAVATGTGSIADPAALAPSYGSTDVLWIAVGMNGETSTTGTWTGMGTTPALTNYTSMNSPGLGTDAVGGIHSAIAFRQNAVSSENAPAWGVSAGTHDITQARNAAILIAVRGATPITVTVTESTETDAAIGMSYNATFYDITTATETDLAAATVDFQPLPASETDSAQTLPHSLTRTVTHAAETDTGQAVTYQQPSSYSITLAAETDSAQAVSFAQASSYSLTHAAETDAAQAVGHARTRTATPATETDLANEILELAPLQAEETDAALALDVSTGTYNITAAAETDTATPVTSSTTVTVTRATETDAAQTLTVASASNDYDITPAVETDLANEIVPFQVFPAAETDTAGTLDIVQGVVTISPAAETDTAQALSRVTRWTLPTSEATEPLPWNTVHIGDTAAAMTLTSATGVTFTVAAETDTARTLVVTKPIRKTIGVASETDSVQAVDKDKSVTFTRASTTASAVALTFSGPTTHTLAPVDENDTAVTLDKDKSLVGFTHAAETDSVQPVTNATPVTIGPAVVTATAPALDKDKRVTITLVSETDTVFVMGQGGVYDIGGAATETSAALALTVGSRKPSGTIGMMPHGRITRPNVGRVTREVVV